MTAIALEPRAALRAVNSLEVKIVTAEDEATDSLLWEQAARVVDCLESGMSQRKVAAGWINPRTGRSYSAQHVNNVKAVFVKYTGQDITFRTAYWRVANPAPHGTLSESHEWYTPEKYITAARTVLGAIDLDPASCAQANRTVRAITYYDKKVDGLSRPWNGRIWLNPPWGKWTAPFVGRLLEEFRAGRVSAAVLLVNAHSTDAEWFRPLWDLPTCFTDHRIDYDSDDEKDTSSTHGSVFAYCGAKETLFAKTFAPFGAIVRRWKP